MNDLSVAKTPYHAVYPPLNAAKFFDGTGPLSDADFRMEEQRLAYDPTTEELLAKALNVIQGASVSPRRAPRGFEDLIERKGPEGKRVTTLAKMNEVLGWKESEKELEVVIEDINDLLEALERVPKAQRGFLLTCIGRSKPGRGHGGTERSYVSCHEIESALGIDARTITKNVDILDEYDLAFLDIDEPNKPTIVLRRPDAQFNVFEELKSFSQKAKVSLEKMIVDLDFSALD